MRRACATVQAFAVLAALPLGAAELTHRWSFNGDCSDSMGGVDAVKCGTYVSLYGGRKKIVSVPRCTVLDLSCQ